jgi:perosamine synthetase
VFAAGVEAGDEAITTPLTFCATANAVLYQGGTPVFADVGADTLTIDPDQAARRVTPRTKALLPVDYAGHPADLDAMLALADRHGLVIIEDAAHALGAAYRGRAVGSISHMTVFSFHPVKHLTTGEGGLVTTADAGLARRLRLFRNHGIDRDSHERQSQGTWYYEMTALGYNYRLTDIACALGLAQVPRLAANVARRRAIAARYGDALAGVPGLTLPRAGADVAHAWHLYPVRVVPPVDRGDVFRALHAEGLGVNVHYVPVHLHPYYRDRFGYRGGECPVAEAAYRDLISLPMFHAMTDADVEDVTSAVTKVMAHFGSGVRA